MNGISVVTIVKDRAAHLERQLKGLASGHLVPREIVIVDMSDEPVAFPAPPFAHTVVPMRGAGLPLAAARNRGAAAASGAHLLFLDVDCIPRADLVATIDLHLSRQDHLFCAEVRYLGPGDTSNTHESDLVAASRPHPHRAFPESGVRLENNAGLFWSLLFGIRRERFFALRGFDEGYRGYGAEDTDFGFRAREAGVPLSFIGGTGAFHQYHGVIDPPMHHLADIVANANRFHARWGIWPMDGWLGAFAARGLIDWRSDAVVLRRLPTSEEIADAAQPPSVYF